MKTIVVHVDGVQGSGKSYICSELQGACYDTDDIAKEAFKTVEQSPSLPKTSKQVAKLCKQRVDSIIREAQGVVVFVGMTVKIPKPDYKFFIQVSDLGILYKRLTLREMQKIVDKQSEVEQFLENTDDPKQFGLIQRITEQSVKFPIDFLELKKDYQERVKKARAKGYKIKHQQDIVEFIQSL
jgi:hypothetical protein